MIDEYSPLLLAFVAVLLSSCGAVLWKYIVSCGVDEFAALAFFHVEATCIVALLLDIPLPHELPSVSLIQLLAAGVCWTVGDFFSVKALRELDAATLGIAGAGEVLLVVVCGIILFGERMSILELTGFAIIVASIAYRFAEKGVLKSPAMLLVAVSVVATAAALVLDKEVAEEVGEEAVVFYGFVLPGVWYSIFGIRKLSLVPAALRATKGLLLAGPMLAIGSYVCFVAALARGELSTTYLINQLSYVFIFLLEAALLKTYTGWRRKTAAAVGCAVGAALIFL